MKRDPPLSDARKPQPPTAEVSASLMFLLAVACGLVVANIYYVQPIVGLVSRDYGLPISVAGVLVTLTQVGYALGLVFIVPLGDLVENRRLILILLAILVGALVVACVAPSAVPFLAACVAIGVASSAVQVIVPFAGHLVSDETRGRVVGKVVSGLLFGIMLARPTASFAAEFVGPRSIFGVSAVAIGGLALVMLFKLPSRRPAGMPYIEMLASLGPLLRDTATLHRRGAYQAAMFGAFSLFWTAVPLLLEGPSFRLSQAGIGLFALVGAGGALVSPFVGRAADAGLSYPMTGVSLGAALASFLAALAGGVMGSLPLLVLAAFVLDMAVAATLVTGQRAIFSLAPETRGRLNGLYLALFFAGGATGSLAASVAFAHGGWTRACWVGLVFPVLALAYFATER